MTNDPSSRATPRNVDLVSFAICFAALVFGAYLFAQLTVGMT